jgi:hypothetical protein
MARLPVVTSNSSTKPPIESSSAREARTFADQSVAALAEAVKAGWALPSELNEPDFDALRGRDDFKKLVAEVEAKAGPRARHKDRSPRPTADAPTEGR